MRKIIKKIYRYLFANQRSYGLNKFLFDCSLHGLGIMNYQNSTISGERHFVTKVLNNLLKGIKKPVFFDVGANVGNYSKLLLNEYHNSIIYAIEPHPKNFVKLKENLSSSVKTMNLALGSSKGDLVLFDRDDFEGSSHASLYEDVIKELHHKKTIESKVKINTLDNLAIELGVNNIDLLKIDTEGHELEVLKGASMLLEKQSISVIHIEFNEMNVISRVFFRDIRKMLPGFRFFRLLPNSMIEILEQPLYSEIFAFQNIICLKKELIKIL